MAARLTLLTHIHIYTQDPTGVRVQGYVHTELVEEYGPELAVGAVLLLTKVNFILFKKI